ncbi:MAG TPA: hypothetical protein VHE61_04745 [Opitutaceae bacterium]|nr:hypothetical protein [Opitutaceae bacterium]
MASVYGYRVFGLNVLSDAEVPYWPSGQPPWDVRIAFGDVPEEIGAGELLWNGAFQGRGDRCLLRLQGAGRILVEHGAQITIAPTAGYSALTLAHVLSGTAYAALLYQRRVLCLHACAVARDGKAYVVMGPSGAGKSTTASALLAQGCEFLSDDVTAISVASDGRHLAAPSYPSLRLLTDSHDRLANRIAAHAAFDPADEKFRLHYRGAVAAERVPVARICFLEKDVTIVRPHTIPLLGQEKLAALQRSLFRRQMGKIVVGPTRLAELILELAQAVEVVRLTRPERGFTVDELCALILEPGPASLRDSSTSI